MSKLHLFFVFVTLSLVFLVSIRAESQAASQYSAATTARINAAITDIKSGNDEQGLMRLKEMIKANRPADKNAIPQIKELMGELLCKRMGRRSEGAEVLQEVVRDYPGTDGANDAKNALAEIHIDKAIDAGAAKVVDTIEKSSNSSEAYRYVQYVINNKQVTDKNIDYPQIAINAFSRRFGAAARPEELEQLYAQLAEHYTELRKIDIASRLYKKLLIDHPKSSMKPEYLIDLAVLANLSQDSNQALKYIDQVSKLDISDNQKESVLECRALSFRDKRMPEKANEYLAEDIKLCTATNDTAELNKLRFLSTTGGFKRMDTPVNKTPVWSPLRCVVFVLFGITFIIFAIRYITQRRHSIR